MPITILLVDDSEVIRFLFAKSLERDPDLRIVGTAANGVEAIAQAQKLQPDMVLLDIEMPEMDGLTALPKILAVSRKSKVFIISGASRDNANASITSLGLGASDFILKPGAEGAMKPAEFNEELRVKIKAICADRLLDGHARTPLPRPAADLTATIPRLPIPENSTEPSTKKLSPVTSLRKPFAPITPMARSEPAASGEIRLQLPKHTIVNALAIASSTGGPEALLKIFGDLKGGLKHIPIFITQHMPPIFTVALAEHIARAGNRLCREAIDGEVVEAGMTYIAPGGYHMLVKKQGDRTIIQLTQDPPVNSCRPSADPMFASISSVYGRNTLGLVLTGIGTDGAEGARVVFDNGGSVFAQNQETCVVYGMPKATVALGVCEAILPLDEIASKLIFRCGGK